jgi:parallel beta-helix repeat protein
VRLFFQSFTSNTLSENGSHPISIYANFTHTIGTGNSISTNKGILVKGDDIEQDNAIWLKQTCPYIIGSNIYVESTTASKLTLMPGVEVQMGNGTSIYMRYHSGTFGTLIAEGTEQERISITSSAPEMSKSPGDWDMLAFYGGAGTSSSLAYCDIEYGGGDNENYGMIFVQGSNISITHSTIRKSPHVGIALRAEGAFTGFSDNMMEGNGKYPIEIYSNWAHTIGAGNTFATGPGIFLNGDDMEQSDATWLKHNVPYILDGNHYIESSSGANLTIEAGTTVKFTESSALYVGYHSGTFGNLMAEGTAGNEIVFTSGAAAGFEAPGDWDGLWFYNGTGSGTILDHCIISYGGGYNANSGNLNIRNGTAGVPVISNCQIKYSEAWGIYLGNNASPQLTDNTFTSNSTGASNQ